MITHPIRVVNEMLNIFHWYVYCYNLLIGFFWFVFIEAVRYIFWQKHLFSLQSKDTIMPVNSITGSHFRWYPDSPINYYGIHHMPCRCSFFLESVISLSKTFKNTSVSLRRNNIIHPGSCSWSYIIIPGGGLWRHLSVILKVHIMMNRSC